MTISVGKAQALKHHHFLTPDTQAVINSASTVQALMNAVVGKVPPLTADQVQEILRQAIMS